ncbi:MAG: hypothetical protein E4G91_06650 [Candidatus Zixiibacteriota bacterium]|nr:MAG: hypothetical protein E4G91_06650 [candidate division Zixibacteria bacterium]
MRQQGQTFRRLIPNGFFLILLLAAFGLSVIARPNANGQGCRLKLSYSQRVRIEATNNATTLDNDAQAGSSYLRNRTSVMLQAFPSLRWEVAAKLTNELRYYFVPETKGMNWDDVFFDLLYIKCDSLGGRPVTVTLGRQNISLGEGFLVMDGGPLDGSRSAYFNAININWQFNPKNNLTLIYANQPEQNDLLPIIHDQDKALVEQPEQAFIAYYSSHLKSTALQAYAMRKNIGATSTKRSASVNCVGSYVQVPATSRLTVTGELAAQIGKRAGADQQAFGGYVYAEYKTGWPVHFPRTFTLGTLYLSGDNPTTDKYEGWEPMFGRWPKWSDLYIYTLVRETGAAYWTNFASIFAKTSIVVVPDLTLSFDLHHLLVPQKADPETSFPGGRGKNRGNLLIGKLTYQMNKHVSGQILWENLDPGNYYFDGADDCAWMRMEFLLKF